MDLREVTVANRQWTALLLLILWACTSPVSAQDDTPLELSPYRVQVSVAFTSGPEVTTSLRQTVLDDLRRQLRRAAGAAWDFDVHENTSLWPADETGLQRLPPGEPPALPGEAEADKAYLLAIDLTAPMLRVSGREWDAATRRLGPIQTIEFTDRRAAAEHAVGLIARLFHPVLAVETIEPDGVTIRLRLRAGALLATEPDDEALRRQLSPGDLLQPYLRYLDREHQLREVQQVPWSYLRVEGIERGRVTATLVSGLRAPLGTGAFRRVEPIALGLRPRAEHTLLQLVARTDPPRPISGTKVRIVPKTHAHEESQAEETTLLTDRSGRLRLEPNADQPLVWLYVHSGEALLARVPFLPGLEPTASIELPDDSLRLAVEGEIDLLKGRLIDAVARRATLIARIRKLANEGDWQNVQPARRELDRVTSVGEFQSQLSAIRVPALEKADALRDRIAAARIRQLCDQAADLIRRYLDPDTLRALDEELHELRRLNPGPGA